MTIGSRKTVPLRMFRIVPFGDLHISFKLNSAISKKWRSGDTFDSSLVGSDGGTLDTDVVFLDSMSSINGDLIIGGITVLHSQIVVFDVNVQEREDELFLDHFPDDSGLLVSIELYDRIVDLDLLFHYRQFTANQQERYQTWLFLR